MRPSPGPSEIEGGDDGKRGAGREQAARCEGWEAKQFFYEGTMNGDHFTWYGLHDERRSSPRYRRPLQEWMRTNPGACGSCATIAGRNGGDEKGAAEGVGQPRGGSRRCLLIFDDRRVGRGRIRKRKCKSEIRSTVSSPLLADPKSEPSLPPFTPKLLVSDLPAKLFLVHFGSVRFIFFLVSKY